MADDWMKPASETVDPLGAFSPPDSTAAAADVNAFIAGGHELGSENGNSEQPCSSTEAALRTTIQSLQEELSLCQRENQNLQGRVAQLEAEKADREKMNGAVEPYKLEERREPEKLHATDASLDAMHEFFCMMLLSISLSLPFENRVELDPDAMYAEACAQNIPMWEWHTWLSGRMHEAKDLMPESEGVKQEGKMGRLMQKAEKRGWFSGRCPTDPSSSRQCHFRSLGLDDSAAPPVSPLPMPVPVGGGQPGDYVAYGAKPTSPPQQIGDSRGPEQVPEVPPDAYTSAVQEGDSQSLL